MVRLWFGYVGPIGLPGVGSTGAVLSHYCGMGWCPGSIQQYILNTNLTNFLIVIKFLLH